MCRDVVAMSFQRYSYVNRPINWRVQISPHNEEELLSDQTNKS